MLFHELFGGVQKHESYEIRTCIAPNHNIVFTSCLNSDLVLKIKLEINTENKTDAVWYMRDRLLKIVSPKSEIYLPFFEPDFSNLHKLKQKVKTYILFS
jgi:hypothetical protein